VWNFIFRFSVHLCGTGKPFYKIAVMYIRETDAETYLWYKKQYIVFQTVSLLILIVYF
jgi:hypothetical protein